MRSDIEEKKTILKKREEWKVLKDRKILILEKHDDASRISKCCCSKILAYKILERYHLEIEEIIFQHSKI